MKKYFGVVILLLVNQAAFAATAQVNSVWNGGFPGANIAPSVVAPLDSLVSGTGTSAVPVVKTLWAHDQAATANGHVGFADLSNGVLVYPYKCPTTKSCEITQMCIYNQGNATLFYQWGYNDVTFTPNALTGSLTNPVYSCGAVSTYCIPYAPAASAPFCISMSALVAHDKFLFIQHQSESLGSGEWTITVKEY